MKDILIKGGRIIDPAAKRDETADLLVRDGKVARAGTKPGVDAAVIDATGMVVSPGFIDLHTHLREPGGEEKETIASGTRALKSPSALLPCPHVSCSKNSIPWSE